jgi:hypothetical protein
VINKRRPRRRGRRRGLAEILVESGALPAGAFQQVLGPVGGLLERARPAGRRRVHRLERHGHDGALDSGAPQERRARDRVADS